LSQATCAALQRRRRETAEPIHHIVRAALAEHLQLSHSTLFQVSTSGALVEGIYTGAVDVARLREHGDFGIGTFEGLDGEMVALEGRFHQVRSDGRLREGDEGDPSPFALVIWVLVAGLREEHRNSRLPSRFHHRRSLGRRPFAGVVRKRA